MVFRLFKSAKYHELAPELINVKELNFKEADIWVDVDNKRLILDTDNGRVDVNFNDYNELLDAVIRIGRSLFIYDMIDVLNQARDQLVYNRRYPQSDMAESELAKLISSIEKAKDNLLKNNFTLVLKLGYLKKEYIDSFISSYPETKKAISYGTERYRELCWETYEDNDPNYCDKVVPVIDIIVYTIPEDKRIIFTVYVDQIGEVYRVVKVYDNAYDFLKAYEEYGFITDNH